MLGRFAAGLLLAASLSGCQALPIAALSVGMNILGDAVGISTSLKDNIRDATGGCVTWYFKSVPCPEPVKP